MEILYQNASIVIAHEASTGILECRWIGFQNFSTIEPAGQEILRLVRKLQIKKILNDNTFVQGHWSDSTDWTSEYWFPQVWSAGVERFAWVYPVDYFAYVTIKAIPKHPSLQYFETRNRAKSWLEEPDASVLDN